MNYVSKKKKVWIYGSKLPQSMNLSSETGGRKNKKKLVFFLPEPHFLKFKFS